MSYKTILKQLGQKNSVDLTGTNQLRPAKNEASGQRNSA